MAPRERMQFTTRPPTPHGGSRLVQAIYLPGRGKRDMPRPGNWSDTRLYDHTTTVIHGTENISPRPTKSEVGAVEGQLTIEVGKSRRHESKDGQEIVEPVLCACFTRFGASACVKAFLSAGVILSAASTNSCSSTLPTSQLRSLPSRVLVFVNSVCPRGENCMN